MFIEPAECRIKESEAMTSQANRAGSLRPPAAVRAPVQASPVIRTLTAPGKLADGGVLASQNAQQITKMVAKL